MRVVAGAAKGIRLAPVPRGSGRSRTWPVKGSSRASPVGRRRRVLDLYAGSGALGIEALSRGAEGSSSSSATASP